MSVIKNKNKKTFIIGTQGGVASGWLTEAAAVARHDQTQTSSDDALRPSHRRLLERARVLVKEGVDAVGRWRTAVPHYGLCRTEEAFC